MHVDVLGQAQVFGQAFLLGTLLGLVYDGMRTLRRSLKLPGLAFLLDLLFHHLKLRHLRRRIAEFQRHAVILLSMFVLVFFQLILQIFHMGFRNFAPFRIPMHPALLH